jgi:DNA-binding NarL/FixJ family response regulator
MKRVRILVVDDHQMLREALVGMLELSGFEVVGASPTVPTPPPWPPSWPPTWS